MIDDPEEEAWQDMEKRHVGAQGWRKAVIARAVSIDEAFGNWEHSHRPDQYHVEMRAFKAGWLAAVRNGWAKERND